MVVKQVERAGRVVEEQAVKPAMEPVMRRAAPIVRTNGLLAEYSVGMRPSGEWFALGTVRGEDMGFQHPAWVLVGMGTSQEDAVASLTARLKFEADRLSAA